MEESEQKQRNAANKRGAFALWGSIIATGALGYSLAQGIVGVYHHFSDQLHTNSECCRDYQAYKTEDSYQRRYWVGVIDKMQDRISDHGERLIRLRDSVELVRTKPTARPDPWTGTQARAESQRIDLQIEAIKDRIKRLENRP